MREPATERWPDGSRDLRYLEWPADEPVTAAEWSAHARNAEREARELAELSASPREDDHHG